MKPFKFKEFAVHQDRCAMKIGTDGVLLGAWAAPKNAFSILDIGSGTGIISLQMAQRSFAEVIDAIEIDADAFEQTVENFERSDWGDRLFCYHASLQEFAEEMEDEEYDFIISNPPFYNSTFKSNEVSEKRRGTGYSGIITIAEPGQAILERSSIILKKDILEVRFFIGLPGVWRWRRIVLRCMRMRGIIGAMRLARLRYWPGW